MLHIKENAMPFRLYSKCFPKEALCYPPTFFAMISGDKDSIHLFYYITVPSSNDAVEEDPNLYKGCYNSFSKGTKFVDLGNIRPADGPPFKCKQLNLQSLQH